MNEEEKINGSPEDGKTESPEEVQDESQDVKSETSNVDEEEINKSEIPKSEITMEVHHHPHVEKKGFKEYLLEGLMIFVAVTAGFFAESYREYLGDRTKEHEYIASILVDIKTDTALSNKVLLSLNRTKLGLDSLMDALASPDVYENSNNAYRLWSKTIGFADFIANDGTIQQLKNNGGLRLITNKAVSDSIMKYDEGVRIFYGQAELMNRALTDQVMYDRFFDFIAFKKSQNASTPIPLPEDSKKLVNEAYANRKIWQYGLLSLIKRLQEVNEEGTRVIQFINKQYHPE
jgi:hypothetical protein